MYRISQKSEGFLHQEYPQGFALLDPLFLTFRL